MKRSSLGKSPLLNSRLSKPDSTMLSGAASFRAIGQQCLQFPPSIKPEQDQGHEPSRQQELRATPDAVHYESMSDMQRLGEEVDKGLLASLTGKEDCEL